MTKLIIPASPVPDPGGWQASWLRDDHGAVLVAPGPDMNIAEWGHRLGELLSVRPGASLVAEGLGANLVIGLAANGALGRASALLLVNPLDVDLVPVAGFGARLPQLPLGVPAILVAGYSGSGMSVHRAHAFANMWEASVSALGTEGEGDSWPLGKALLARLERSTKKDPRTRASGTRLAKAAA